MTSGGYSKKQAAKLQTFTHEWVFCPGKTTLHLVPKGWKYAAVTSTLCGQQVFASTDKIKLKRCKACVRKSSASPALKTEGA